jgi:hypothetical protein
MSDLTMEMIFDAWWASMNKGFEQHIAWDNARHAPWCKLYLHCGIEETGSPGIICIVRYIVLRRPSESGTSSLGKHLPAKVHITK